MSYARSLPRELPRMPLPTGGRNSVRFKCFRERHAPVVIFFWSHEFDTRRVPRAKFLPSQFLPWLSTQPTTSPRTTMMLRSTQAPRPPVHRFSTLTSTKHAARIGNRSLRPERQSSAEQRVQSALFLVPRSQKPRLARRWMPRLADGIFLSLALAAMVALCWTLL